jgi:hypothetical protein
MDASAPAVTLSPIPLASRCFSSGQCFASAAYVLSVSVAHPLRLSVCTFAHWSEFI